MFQTHRNASLAKSLAFALIIVVVGLGIAFSTKFLSQNTDLRSRASANNYPITGTFYMADTNATAAQLKLEIQEMADTGINTIIIVASGYLDKTNGVYKEITYFDDPNNTTKDVMKSAYESGMDIYIGLAAYDSAKVVPAVGTPANLNTDQGRMIDYSVRLVDAINTAATAQGIPLNKIKGYYFGELGPANLLYPADLAYWKYLSQKVKAKVPDKKILISPYVLQTNTYAYMKSVYVYVYQQTAIDIIAPQDSMGTGKVTTYAKSAELFRALRDATAAFPGREAWANIETFYSSVDNGQYVPSTIARVSQQVNAAKPHVTKMISWMYQHNMLSVPAFDNMYSWTGQYTPANALLRKKLRQDYRTLYGSSNLTPTPTPRVLLTSVPPTSTPKPTAAPTALPTSVSITKTPPLRQPNVTNSPSKPVIENVFFWGDNVVVKGTNFGVAGTTVKLTINYGFKQYANRHTVYQEGAKQTVYIAKTSLPGFNPSPGKYTISIQP